MAHHYSKRISHASSYSFWVSKIAKTRELAKEYPEAKIIPAKSLRKQEPIESFKSPDGQKYAIVAEEQKQEAVPEQDKQSAGYPWEAKRDPNDSDFQALRASFEKKFGRSYSSSESPTYVLSATHKSMIVDVNDPKIFSSALNGPLGLKLKTTIGKMPPKTKTVAQARRAIKALPEGTKYSKIGPSSYNVEILKRIMNIFHKGYVMFYPMNEGPEKYAPLAISDTKGHFIVLAGDPNEEGAPLF